MIKVFGIVISTAKAHNEEIELIDKLKNKVSDLTKQNYLSTQKIKDITENRNKLRVKINRVTKRNNDLILSRDNFKSKYKALKNVLNNSN